LKRFNIAKKTLISHIPVVLYSVVIVFYYLLSGTLIITVIINIFPAVKPTVVPLNEDSLIKSVGKPLEIECSGQGDPLPTVEWTIGGKVFSNQKVRQYAV
jgi:hypothetical protein